MKLNSSCLIFFMLFITVASTAQIKISGKVTDLSTHAPVPFATLGIKNKSVGTVADENGKFSFDLPKDSIETHENFVITSVGYKDMLIAVSSFTKGFQEIVLVPQVTLLDQVKVKPTQFKTKTFGRTGRSAFMTTSMITERNHISDESGKEIGTVIPIHKNCLLRNFKLFVIFNHFKNIKFRLNIYSVKNGLPDSLLIHDPIIFDVKYGRQSWTNVDLAPYHIQLEGLDKIAVVIQWLKSEVKEDDPKRSLNVAAVPSVSDFILFRDKSQSKWLKVKGYMSFNVTADCFKF